MTEKEFQERQLAKAKYDAVLQSLSVILSQNHGKKFMKYIFDEFDVVEPMPEGLHGEMLIEVTSFKRAGMTIYRMCLEASPELTGQVVTELIKEKMNNEENPFVNEQCN